MAFTRIQTGGVLGSNGSRLGWGKVEIQRLADETGLTVAVSHFPAGASKWNRIEHRLSSFIGKSWRGQPLTGLRGFVNLIAGITARKSLKVHAAIDARRYPAGITEPCLCKRRRLRCSVVHAPPVGGGHNARNHTR